jgi:rSAM/selenodomain-associated transferase 1
MENNRLLIVFVKNIKLGKVKTRLAKSIGDEGAFEVYKHLVEITEKETERLVDCDLHIYYSDLIIDTKWKNHAKFVQAEGDLGSKMQDAFERGFNLGYSSIIGIGSDLPSLTAEIIEEGFEVLEKNDLVFGPAKDGGYYLLGMKQIQKTVFKEKPWSTSDVLALTLDELKQHKVQTGLLTELNDIDTLKDLMESELNEKFKLFIKQ